MKPLSNVTDSMLMICFYSPDQTISKNFKILLILTSHLLWKMDYAKNVMRIQISLLDIEINRNQKKFNTTVFRKHTFRGAYTDFDSFLPGTYDLLAIQETFSHMFISTFQSQLTLLKEAFWKSVSQKTLLMHLLKCFWVNKIGISKRDYFIVQKKVQLFVFSQPAFTCSKLTTETLNKMWNMFKANNKSTRTTPLVSFCCIYC